jgi:hypothetical protein
VTNDEFAVDTADGKRQIDWILSYDLLPNLQSAICNLQSRRAMRLLLGLLLTLHALAHGLVLLLLLATNLNLDWAGWCWLLPPLALGAAASGLRWRQPWWPWPTVGAVLCSIVLTLHWWAALPTLASVGALLLNGLLLSLVWLRTPHGPGRVHHSAG